MKEVYYKGKPYAYKTSDVNGKRQYQLFEEGVLKHSVEEGELDIRSVVSHILDAYYRTIKPATRSAVLG